VAVQGRETPAVRSARARVSVAVLVLFISLLLGCDSNADPRDTYAKKAERVCRDFVARRSESSVLVGSGVEITAELRMAASATSLPLDALVSDAAGDVWLAHCSVVSQTERCRDVAEYLVSPTSGREALFWCDRAVDASSTTDRAGLDRRLPRGLAPRSSLLIAMS
jgi:hypothetical protein